MNLIRIKTILTFYWELFGGRLLFCQIDMNKLQLQPNNKAATEPKSHLHSFYHILLVVFDRKKPQRMVMLCESRTNQLGSLKAEKNNKQKNHFVTSNAKVHFNTMFVCKVISLRVACKSQRQTRQRKDAQTSVVKMQKL